MITLSQYNAKFEECYKRMTRVRNLASALKDGRFWFGATSFRLDVDKYMKTIKSVNDAYNSAPSYQSKDFTQYVEKLEYDVKGYEEYLIKVKEISEATRKAGY